MKIKDKFKNFFESEKTTMTCNLNGDDFVITKIDLYDSKYKMIYMETDLVDFTNSMYNKTFFYNCTIDDKGNIVHISEKLFDSTCRLFGIELEENEYILPKKAIEDEIKSDILNYFENEFKDIKDMEIKEDYKLYSAFEPKFPSFYTDDSISKDFLYKYLTNKDELIKEEKENFIKCKKNNFKNFFEQKRIYEVFQEKINDPFFIRKKKIADILSDIASKDIIIYFTDLNNNEQKKECHISFNVNTKFDSIKYFLDIPIKAITKIAIKSQTYNSKKDSTYDKENIIYNSIEFPEVEYEIEEKEKDFLDQKLFKYLSDKFYNDANFMKDLMLSRGTVPEYLDYLGDKLKNNTDFIIELLKEDNRLILYIDNIPNDVNFGIKFLEISKDWDYDYNNETNDYKHFLERVFKAMPKEFYKLDNIKKYYKYLDSDSANEVLLRLPDKILNSNECLEFLKKEQYTDLIYSELKDRIKNIDVLIAFMGANNIMKNQLSEEDFKNKEYINYLLDHVTDSFSLDPYLRDHLIEEYKDDFNMIKKIINFEDDYDVFLSEWEDIRTKDIEIDEIYEMASINIDFLKALSKEEQLIYLKDEFAGFENIGFVNGVNIYFETNFGSLYYDNLDTEDPELVFYDTTTHSYNLKDLKDEMLKIIIDELHDRYPDFKGSKVEDIMDYLNNIAKEKER